jgi:hypothetical protein
MIRQVLKFGDDLLDHVADPVDLRIEFFLPAQEVAKNGLPDGGDQVFSDAAVTVLRSAGCRRR